MQEMGWFGAVRGHSRSWAMPPFDRAHTTSYSTLIETMRLSCTVFRNKPVICRKSPILTHPTSIWRPRRWWSLSNFAEISGFRKLESLGYRKALCDPTFSRFSRTPTDTGPWLVPRIISFSRNAGTEETEPNATKTYMYAPAGRKPNMPTTDDSWLLILLSTLAPLGLNCWINVL